MKDREDRKERTGEKLSCHENNGSKTTKAASSLGKM